MADNGYIVVWLDAVKDRDRARVAVSEKFPEFQIQFLNPRHFQGVDSVGVDPRKVRGHVLATDNEDIYRAYVEAGVEFVDMREIPDRVRTEPECVVIYTKAQGNEWNDACRTVARSTFPGMVVRPLPIAKYAGPVAGNVVAVVVPDDEEAIATDYGKMHKQVLRVPRPGFGDPKDFLASGEIDEATLSASLTLPIPNLTAVVNAQSDLLWLRALADAEVEKGNRQDVHEIINTRMSNLGDANPYYVAMAQDDAEEPESAAEPSEAAEVGDSSPGEPEAAGEAPVPATHDMSYIAGMSARKIGEALQSIDDGETLGAMLASETTGKNRDSVVALIERRIRAIS